MSKKITVIDLDVIAKKMINQGFKVYKKEGFYHIENPDGWTNTLMDILTRETNLEGDVEKRICFLLGQEKKELENEELIQKAKEAIREHLTDLKHAQSQAGSCFLSIKEIFQKIDGRSRLSFLIEDSECNTIASFSTGAMKLSQEEAFQLIKNLFLNQNLSLRRGKFTKEER